MKVKAKPISDEELNRIRAENDIRRSEAYIKHLEKETDDRVKHLAEKDSEWRMHVKKTEIGNNITVVFNVILALSVVIFLVMHS